MSSNRQGFISQSDVQGQYAINGQCFVKTQEGIFSVIAFYHLEIRWRVIPLLADDNEKKAIAYFDSIAQESGAGLPGGQEGKNANKIARETIQNTIAQYNARLIGLAKQLNRARAKNDTARISRIQKTIKQCTAEIARNENALSDLD